MLYISEPLNSEYDARAKSTTLRSYEMFDHAINGVAKRQGDMKTARPAP